LRQAAKAHMIEFGHSTHVGLRREHNEDTYYADSDLGLWLVADGMGGHENGEVASALARDTWCARSRPAKPLARRSSGRRGNHQALEPAPQALPMGTTVAAVRVQGNAYEIAWVGDSRVYCGTASSGRSRRTIPTCRN
jgi:serine/threonine protein phosphatase PrpC